MWCHFFICHLLVCSLLAPLTRRSPVFVVTFICVVCTLRTQVSRDQYATSHTISRCDDITYSKFHHQYATLLTR
jgi:hypothetical protein